MKDKPVILVVDDEPQNIELLEAHLVPQGYEIVKAASGEEALEKLSNNQIDLVLLDVIMPRMSGFEVLENADLLPGQLVVSGAYSALGGLAERDDVANIMPASPELAAGIPLAGCAGATTVAGPVGEYVLVSSGWPKDSGGSVSLHYFIR